MYQFYIIYILYMFTDFSVYLKKKYHPAVENLTLGLESRNLFGTLVYRGGYRYDRREKKHYRFFDLSYQGLYPTVDFSISSTNDYVYQNIIINSNDLENLFANYNNIFYTLKTNVCFLLILI